VFYLLMLLKINTLEVFSGLLCAKPSKPAMFSQLLAVKERPGNVPRPPSIPTLHPLLNLWSEGEDGVMPGMIVAVNGQIFFAVPPLDSSHAAVKENGNLFPGVKKFFVRAIYGFG
jgi:hypothetical protein